MKTTLTAEKLEKGGPHQAPVPCFNLYAQNGTCKHSVIYY